jgi:hypothetical protein
MTPYILRQGLKRHWKRVVGGLVVAGLLLPLPAFAGGFLGNWSIDQKKQTGTAPAATASAGLYLNGGTLSIDLGQYVYTGSSTVIANNYYWVDYPSQLLTITEGFNVGIKNASLAMDVIFTPLTPGNGWYWTPQAVGAAGNAKFPFFYYNSSSTYLAGGLYLVSVKIKSVNYNRFSGTKDISPFSITFNGI